MFAVFEFLGAVFEVLGIVGWIVEGGGNLLRMDSAAMIDDSVPTEAKRLRRATTEVATPRFA